MSLFKHKDFFDKTLVYLLALFAFSLPLSYNLSIYLLALSTLIWILSGSWLENFRQIKFAKGESFLLILWILILLSLIYSDNIARGISDIIQKISLLVFPLIFLTSKQIQNSKDKLLNSFILGLISVALFVVFRALYFSVDISNLSFNPIPNDVPWENYFLYMRFTAPYHPTYFSLYFSLGIAIIYSKIILEQRLFYKVLQIFVFMLFVVLIYLSSSKAGLVVASILFLLSVFWIIRKKSRIYAYSLVLLMSVLIVLLMINNSRIAYFINYLGFGNKELSFENKEFENKLSSEATVRIDIWKNIPEIVGKNWLFGVGVGDSKEVLVSGYKKKGVTYAAELKLNAHNQYLETYVGLGFVGLATLLIILFWGFWQAFTFKDILLFMFLVIISVNFLFESIFERIFGVMFFSFFYCLLMIKSKVENESEG